MGLIQPPEAHCTHTCSATLRVAWTCDVVVIFAQITSKSRPKHVQNTVSDCEIAVIFLKKHGDRQHSRHKPTFALRYSHSYASAYA